MLTIKGSSVPSCTGTTNNMVDSSSNSSYYSTSSSSSGKGSTANKKDPSRTYASARKKRPTKSKTSTRSTVIQDVLMFDEIQIPTIKTTKNNNDDGTTQDVNDNEDDGDNDQKIPSKITSSSNTSTTATTTTIGPYDVICGRDKTAFNNIGNRRFRFTISLALPRFLSAKSRKEKSIVIESIRQLVHQNGGRFLITPNDEDDSNNNSNADTVWTELDAKQSHLKVGHALRDAERKLSKAKELQQKQQHRQQKQQPIPSPALQQQQQQQQRNREPIDPLIPIESTSLLSEGRNPMSNITISDPLQQVRSTFDLNDYDNASVSTISYIEGGDVMSSSSDMFHHPQHVSIPQQPRRPSFNVMSAMTERPMTTRRSQLLHSIQHHPVTDSTTTSIYQHRRNQQFHPQHHRPMYNNMPAAQLQPNYSMITDGRQQILQQQPPMTYNTTRTSMMTMNNDNSNTPIPWTGNRSHARVRVPQIQQPTQQQMPSTYSGHGKAVLANHPNNNILHQRHTSVSTIPVHNTEQQHHEPIPTHPEQHDQFLSNMTDDDHQYIMSWLVNESEDVVDDFFDLMENE